MKLIYEIFLLMKMKILQYLIELKIFLKGHAANEKLVYRESLLSIQLELNSHLTFRSSEMAGKLFVTILSSFGNCSNTRSFCRYSL